MAKLLVMEDDVVFSFQLKRGMEAAGHEVNICGTASDAVLELRHTAYDILISDLIVRQNGRSVADGGIKLVGWTRGNPKTQTLPIIAMTGAHRFPGMTHVLTTAEQIGANVSLEKPFQLEELLALIDDFTDIDPEGPPSASVN